MRRRSLALLAASLLLGAIGCTIVVPLESPQWRPAGPRRYTLAGVRHRAEVWHAGPVIGWAWRVVELSTGETVDASTGRGGTESRAKAQAEMALRRAESGGGGTTSPSDQPLASEVSCTCYTSSLYCRACVALFIVDHHPLPPRLHLH